MAGITEIAPGKYSVSFYPKMFVDNLRTEIWSIPQRYIPQHVLGHGSYGTVIACIDVQTQRKVAIKHLHNFAIPARAVSSEPCVCFNQDKTCVFNEQSSRCTVQGCNSAADVCFCHIAPTLIRVLREIAVLKELRAHPNVLKITDIFPPTTVFLGNRHRLQAVSELYIVFNYAGCNLETFMTRCRRMTEGHVHSIMQQLLSAVGFLHRCRVVHRDIKPQNILIYCKCSSSSVEQQESAICNCAPRDLHVVLADFGLCRIVEPSASSVLSPTLSPLRGKAINVDTAPGLSPLNLGIGQFSLGRGDGDSDIGDCDSGCSEGSPGSPVEAEGLGSLESDLLGPGLLARAMSVDILTSNYKAPEVYLRYSESSRLCEYNEKVDVWSVGCVLGELLGLMCSKYNCSTPDKDHCECSRCKQKSRHVVLKRFVMFSGMSPTLTNAKNEDLLYQSNELLWGMMTIVGPPSDADIKHMKCSDVMAPLLSGYMSSIRKSAAVKQQASSTDQQQQQQQGVSAALKAKFAGASDVLLLILQRLLSFDPEARISAGDAYVELLSTSPECLLAPTAGLASSGSSATSGVLPGCAPTPSPARVLKHPIDATLEGGHKAALKTVNDIMRRRGDLDLDICKKPREQLEECMRLLMNEVADVSNL